MRCAQASPGVIRGPENLAHLSRRNVSPAVPKRIMKFAYTILYVPDVTRAVEFYENAFGFQRGFLHESGEYGELQTGSTTLSFASLALAPANIEGGVTPTDALRPPPAFEVAFATDDVPAAFARATAAGAVAASAPKVKPWGQTVAYVRDLNGNLVELCTPIA
jgi:lactoylglutathione lyase